MHAVPKLWTDTVEAHRREVRDAVLDTTAALVARHGLRSVTMSRVAEEVGIGRATLYKYFSDLESILLAWHERQIASHLSELAELRDSADPASHRLSAVLARYARLSRPSAGHRGSDLAARLHGSEDVVRAAGQLHGMLVELIEAGARDGELRSDVPAVELATYCLHALVAADDLESDDAVERLVGVVLTGLHPENVGSSSAPD
ncbi:TetR/AcrR family transcriptional regulator [Geodermatophilus sp. DSM 45219]|uniref:TetR/AcrR family transcriptional regulator n=1 Tax=Geodermatophilus sp. DSM 45219 TaxID=1881103 RepID=UPI0008862331|nr:TetR/AcrR family transcriptional regulator [Geodermatophilus sp. DSM 45219]SDO37676.1 transcriptional regulator, TetR family [Geodermatophilus sp. DSM 45219]